MTEIEFIQQMADLEQEALSVRRANATQIDLIESRHREATQAEFDRYRTELRRQRAEFNTRRDDITRRITDLRVSFAKFRTEASTPPPPCLGPFGHDDF